MLLRIQVCTIRGLEICTTILYTYLINLNWNKNVIFYYVLPSFLDATYKGKGVKEQNDEVRHQYRETPDLQNQFDQIEKLRQKNRERIKDRIQRKNNG